MKIKGLEQLWKQSDVMFQITEIEKVSDEFMFLFNPNFILVTGYSIVLLQAVLRCGGSRCDERPQTAHSIAAAHSTARSVSPEG